MNKEYDSTYFGLVFVAAMVRWNESSPNHIYSEGLFSSEDMAIECGEKTRIYRGGKYSYQHTPCYVNLVPTLDFIGPGLKDSGLIRLFVATVYKNKGFFVTPSNKSHFDGLNFEVQHLLGCFTSKRLAEIARDNIYPGWDLYIDEQDINYNV